MYNKDMKEMFNKEMYNKDMKEMYNKDMKEMFNKEVYNIAASYIKSYNSTPTGETYPGWIIGNPER